MFSIKIYNQDRSSQIAKIRNFSSLTFGDALNSYGIGQFRLDLLSDDATQAILQKYNRISIFDGATEKWRGYIYNWVIRDNFTIDILMRSMLGYLDKKRTITKNYVAQKPEDVFSDIITTMNVADLTEFTYGGSDLVGSGNEDFDFTNTTVFGALAQCAEAANAEIGIDLDDKIYINTEFGSDKTSEVVFKFLQNKMNENNVKSFNVTDDGDRMSNYIISENDEAVPKTSTKSDAGSIATYGRLEEFIKFPDITSQNALDDATQQYLDLHKDPIKNPQFQPLEPRISESLYNIGDLCKIKLKYGFYNLDDDYRIVRKNYTVAKDNTPIVNVQVSNNKISRDDFFKQIAQLQRDVYQLQK